MATKAQFYEVTFKDVNKTWSRIYPAKAANILTNLEEPHVNIIKKECLGHHIVEIRTNQETDNMQFYAKINGKDIFIDDGELGFDYLSVQFAPQVKEYYGQYYG